MSDWDKPVERGKSGGKRKGRENREKEKMREKLLLLSSFPGDPAFGVRRSKRQSLSSRRELRLGTGIGEFRQTPRGRGFSYSVLFLALKPFNGTVFIGAVSGLDAQSYNFGIRGRNVRDCIRQSRTIQKM